MLTVLTHATIYTGKRVIRDGYLRFDQKKFDQLAK